MSELSIGLQLLARVASHDKSSDGVYLSLGTIAPVLKALTNPFKDRHLLDLRSKSQDPQRYHVQQWPRLPADPASLSKLKNEIRSWYRCPLPVRQRSSLHPYPDTKQVKAQGCHALEFQWAHRASPPNTQFTTLDLSFELAGSPNTVVDSRGLPSRLSEPFLVEPTETLRAFESSENQKTAFNA